MALLNELASGLERYTWPVPGELDLSGSCRDAKNDKFLACAVEGEGHYLVSSDRDLLDLRSFRDVVVHSQFVPQPLSRVPDETC